MQDAAAITHIYNQGIEDCGRAFETASDSVRSALTGSMPDWRGSGETWLSVEKLLGSGGLLKGLL